MTHPVFQPNAVAVITGGASGIGLATAQRLAAMGLRLAIVDVREALLEPAAEQLRQMGAPEVMASSTDVSDREALVELEALVAERFGGTDILMNNAGIQPGSTLLDDSENWLRILGVNLGGIVYGTQVFVPRMLERARPGLVINTGSKQGITTPPGDPAYNVSKSAVKTFTEALAHELRNTEGHQLTAHLLIPGFVFTDLTRGTRTEKPAGAWTPEQTAEFLFQSVERGDFYILCPDNDVSRELDEKRIAWAIGDIIENRPPLSRWHPDYTESFNLYINRS
jgi:NAD(P)-dependent dehydrogenase (short-subunit alcohol dehydrogenase family)